MRVSELSCGITSHRKLVMHSSFELVFTLKWTSQGVPIALVIWGRSVCNEHGALYHYGGPQSARVSGHISDSCHSKTKRAFWPQVVPIDRPIIPLYLYSQGFWSTETLGRRDNKNQTVRAGQFSDLPAKHRTNGSGAYKQAALEELVAPTCRPIYVL